MNRLMTPQSTLFVTQTLGVSLREANGRRQWIPEDDVEPQNIIEGKIA